MKEQKKLDEATLGFEPASQLPPAQESAAFNHWAMQPLRQVQLEINSLEVSFSAFHTVEPYGAVFIMNSKIHLRKIAQTSISKPFRIISVFIRALYRPLD